MTIERFFSPPIELKDKFFTFVFCGNFILRIFLLRDILIFLSLVPLSVKINLGADFKKVPLASIVSTLVFSKVDELFECALSLLANISEAQNNVNSTSSESKLYKFNL